MIQQWLNGKTLLFVIAAAIVTGTVFYSSYLAKKIAADEQKRMEIWVEAQHTIADTSSAVNLNLAAKISSENKDIPIIEVLVGEQDSITNNYLNLDSNKIKSDKKYLFKKVEEFKKQHEPIPLVVSENPLRVNRYYYGDTLLQREVQYYPIVQLIIVGLFLTITIVAQRTSYI